MTQVGGRGRLVQWRRRELVGRIVGIAAGAVFIGAMFLPYLDLSTPGGLGQTYNYWELFERDDIIVFVVVLAAVDCLAIGFFVASRTLAAVAVGLAGVALGLAVPYDFDGLHTFGTGGRVMVVAAVVLLIGALLAATAGNHR